MSSTATHYTSLLAPIYTWMVGGSSAAFAMGESDLSAVLSQRGTAVDLGAGFGMHAIPLARAGWRVLAVDSSSLLLGELDDSAAGLAITTRHGDLLRFSEYLNPEERVDLVLCMGDTLTHLESMDQIVHLSRAVASRLAAAGRFIATFRDYTRLPVGAARFIPVRADDHRILTCFLEEQAAYVQVHDLLHERIDGAWSSRVSAYRKLRLSPESVCQAFAAAGLRATIDAGPRGMVRLIAEA
jgi:SAM-dependent methyltransferase